jgi:CRISPR/Cas system-associated exonuclease Cas4 (RecB family)
MLGEDGSCEIVDWKTGRRREEEGAREQLAGYAWFLQRRLGNTFVEGRWTARAVYLRDGEEEQYVITRLDLLRAEHRIRESVERMRGLLSDPSANEPLPREAFPLVHPAFRFRCNRCQYFRLCEREMAVPQSIQACRSVS